MRHAGTLEERVKAATFTLGRLTLLAREVEERLNRCVELLREYECQKDGRAYGPAIRRGLPWNAVHTITTSSTDAAMTSATMVAFIINE
jgi:hypothetical protein